MDIVRLEELKKAYPIGKEKFLALKGINLSFNKGELVSVIGESGSGKSTLMNLIGGLDTDYEGKIYINDRLITNYSPSQLDNYRKKTIGFVFQSFHLISHLTVLENVTLALTLASVEDKTKIEKATKILEEVGLGSQLHKKPNQLSGGQKQRVAIARALINDPDIILADEPTGALDSETTEQILEIIREIAKNRVVIMVTHSMHVASISDRVIEMKDGLVINDHYQSQPKIESKIDDLGKIKSNKSLSFFGAVKLALRNMQAKLARNVLVAIGASIGISSVILMLSIGNGIITYMNDTMASTSNPYLVQVNNVNSSYDDMNAEMVPPLNDTPPFTQAQIDELCALEGVETCDKGVNITTLKANSITYEGQKADLSMLYTTNSTISEEFILSGSLPSENEVMVSENFLETYDTDLVGKTITLNIFVNDQVVSKDYRVSGIYTFGAQMGEMPIAQMGLVYIPYNTLSEMYSEAGTTLEPTTLYIQAESVEYADDIRVTIEEMGYAGSAMEFMAETFVEMISLVSFVLAGIAAISLIVSAIMILVVLYISVVERTQEIGVIKAIGGRRKDIRHIFVSEAFLIGLFSGLVAILTSIGTAFIANQISMKFVQTNIVIINWEYLVFALLTSITLSVLAGIYPANKASKLDPVESLRHE